MPNDPATPDSHPSNENELNDRAELFTPWPPAGTIAIWDELLAILSGKQGSTLTSGMLRREGPINRHKPLDAKTVRQRRALELLGHLAESMKGTEIPKKIKELTGPDITGRGDAIRLLNRAIAVHTSDPALVFADKELCELVEAMNTTPGALHSLARFRDELSCESLRPAADEGKTREAKGGKSAARSGGKPNLRASKIPKDIARLNVYELIRAVKDKNPKWGKKAITKHYTSDSDFKRRIKEAGDTFGNAFFHKALKWIKDNPSTSHNT